MVPGPSVREWSPMAAASCPFCGSEVPVDLVAYGGTCPKCLAEIPGDEAPTDPGVEVRKKQERSDRLRARIPLVVAFGLLFTLVSCTGVVALGVVLWPEPEVAELLDFDTMDFPMPEVVTGPEATPGAEAPAPGKAKTKGKEQPAPGPQPGKTSKPQPVAEAPAPAAGPEPEPGSTSPRPAPSGSVGISIGGPRVRRDDGRTLEDPEEIRMMIGERMAEGIPTLQVCYERRLKVDESLAGRWSLTFTVQPNGTTSSVAVKGIERQDAELESCVAGIVSERWRFSKINVQQPVKRTIRFSR
jgi:hypothetical protein